MQVNDAVDKATLGHAANHLRQAAACILKEAILESSAMFDPTLVRKVLGILRALPGRHSLMEAIEVCASAAAVLNNLYACLGQSDLSDALRHQFRSLLAADEKACSGLVHWGLARPESAKKLHSGQVICWALQDDPTLRDHARTDRLLPSPIWTPLVLCSSFLALVPTQDQPKLCSAFAEAANPITIRSLLQVAAQHPCRRFPRCSLVHLRRLRAALTTDQGFNQYSTCMCDTHGHRIRPS